MGLGQSVITCPSAIYTNRKNETAVIAPRDPNFLRPLPDEPPLHAVLRTQIHLQSEVLHLLLDTVVWYAMARSNAVFRYTYERKADAWHDALHRFTEAEHKFYRWATTVDRSIPWVEPALVRILDDIQHYNAELDRLYLYLDKLHAARKEASTLPPKVVLGAVVCWVLLGALFLWRFPSWDTFYGLVWGVLCSVFQLVAYTGFILCLPIETACFVDMVAAR